MRELLSKRFATTQRGLTLIEAMITLAIAAILLTLAVPSLQDFITRNRLNKKVKNFVAALYVARCESVMRQQKNNQRPSATPPTCASNNNWHQGWSLYSNVNGTNEVIQQNPPLPGDRFVITSGRNVITFNPRGQSGTNDTFTICDTGAIANTRRVVLSPEGRVRTEKLTTSGGCGG